MSVVRWFAPVLPDARVAILRSVLYVFVIVDMHLFVRDTRALSYHPELYRPLFLARLLQLPPPSITLTTALYVVLWIACLVGAANRLPRVAGFVVAACFTWWTAIGMSYGKVDHDHLALVVALWVLPTVGAVRGSWRSEDSSAQAGWALRCIQFAVVFTYFLSAITKIRSGDWTFTSWPNSAILTWAIIRRPHGLGLLLVEHPSLLRGMQWFSFLAELSSIVILWLRGRALLCAALFWVGFHLVTAMILYIHFAPTLVCWLAFAPLERGVPWARRVIARRRQRAGGSAARHPVAVVGDQPVDGTG
ncbi:HTTM domain-containing protein [Microlunatus panaciterrae]|uniref:Vitamin K-dependent gamma-carboxylase n=1 Tax=Microlunatus panaciterrae TaxID=400768 RepID=A0ABS2RGU4_9ACTN|nr:HTTM domain-containing protein [Microlunatus panaciterrae]MBM7797757.1 hypothetical protein [Microlunatus panaciterrae]